MICVVGCWEVDEVCGDRDWDWDDALMIDYGVLSLSTAAANTRASTEEVSDEREEHANYGEDG